MVMKQWYALHVFVIQWYVLYVFLIQWYVLYVFLYHFEDRMLVKHQTPKGTP